MVHRIIRKIIARFKNYFGYLFTNLRFFLRSFKNINDSDKLNEFKSYGLVKVENAQSVGLSDEVLQAVQNFIDSGVSNNSIKLCTLFSSQDGSKSFAIDLNSPILFERIFTPELFSLIEGYFRTSDFKMRNNATIEFTSAEQAVHDQELFHIDWGLRQLSLMVNLSDVDEESSFMIYLKGSNRKYWFRHPSRDSMSFKAEVQKYIEQNPNCVAKTIGQKDSIFLFDAGNGFHRRCKQGARVVLHLNFVENFVFNSWNSKDLPSLNHLSSKYWSSSTNAELDTLIRKSHWPANVFSYVAR